MSDQFEYLDLDTAILSLGGQSQTSAILENLTTLTRLKAGLSSTRRSITRSIQNQPSARELYSNWLSERGYLKITKGGVGSVLYIRDSHIGHVDVLLYITERTDSIHCIVDGDPVEVDTIIQWIKDTFPTLGTLVNVAIKLDKVGDVVFRSDYLTHTSAQIACDSFYPWLSIPLMAYFKAFMESDEPVLFLLGPPGTGKSTLIRSLILSGNYESMLAYDQTVVESSSLITRFYDSRARILAYEDIDSHVKNRADGNLLMATLLNASEGVLQHPGKKIIFSTNLPDINKIDPALLRVGRCFDILEFRYLTAAEATTILADMGEKPRDFINKDSWSLAEVLNKQNHARQTINRFGKRAGFIK